MLRLDDSEQVQSHHEGEILTELIYPTNDPLCSNSPGLTETVIEQLRYHIVQILLTAILSI